MPPHVTILFPFVPPARIGPEVRAAIASVAFATPRLRVRLAQLRRFPKVLYLVPEPTEVFSEMTELLVARYPEYPPYGGVFNDLVPHLTIATGAPHELDAIEGEARSHLPLEIEAKQLILLEEVAAGGRRWRNRGAFSFAPMRRASNP